MPAAWQPLQHGRSAWHLAQSRAVAPPTQHLLRHTLSVHHQADRHQRFLSAAAAAGQPTESIRYLYDGGCKVCQTFKSALEAERPGGENIDFVDIARPDYDPAKNNNIDYDAAMSTIHAIRKDGRTVKGPDAVSELFAAAGPRLGLIGTMSKLPGFNIIFGLMYDTISHNRFAISKAATRVSEAVGRK